LLGSCKANMFRARVARLYRSASLISTIDSENFHDMSRSLFKTLDLFTDRASWEEIREAMNRSGAGLFHTDNYVFPHDRRRLDHEDSDGDGVADRRDPVFHTGLQTPPSTSAGGYAAKTPVADPCHLVGDKVGFAVTMAN